MINYKINYKYILLAFISQRVFAAETCPVDKTSLARQTTCEAYKSLKQATEEDTKVDAACLKLGRTSAIFRRTQGEPLIAGAPLVPAEWKTRAEEIEGFCGVGTNATLPRGLLNVDFVMNENGMKQFLRDRIQETSAWIEENKEREPQGVGCKAPAALAPECQLIP